MNNSKLGFIALIITIRMAFQAGGTYILIAVYFTMVVVCFGLLVTSKTGEICIVTRIGMAINTIIPLASVFPAVNREILAVVIKGGRGPTGVSGVT